MTDASLQSDASPSPEPDASPEPGASPEPALSPALPVWLRRAVLAALSLVLLLPAMTILRSLPIYGDDHSSHLAAVHHLLSLLRAGHTDLFCPTFNLGFPMYLYYQPLPHLSAALACLLSFGLLGEQLTFNLTVVALWCLYPLTTYLGARRLGLGDTASLTAAASAPMVSSSLPFGLTLHSVMGLGLYTQLYAMVLFPLCLGWTWRALHDVQATRRSTLAAAGLQVLIWTSHAFYGVALATAAALMVLARPGRLRVSFPRLLRIGLITLGSLLFWLIPLALTRDHAGGWPWDGVDRWEGYGARHVLGELVRGRLFDDQQLPLLSLALGGGLALALLRARRSPRLRTLLLLFLVFLLFLIGRRSLGVLVDLQPANRGLQLFRYLGPLHGVGVMLAAVGLSALVGALGRKVPRSFALGVLAMLLLPPLVGLTLRGRALFHTIRAYHIKDHDLAAAGEAIALARRRGTPAGRIYAHNRVETGAHLVAAATALYTDQPMGQSYGLSMHDSLGFYYLEHLDPLDTGGRALYNFRYALTAPGTAFARQQLEAGNQPLLRRSTLLLFALRGDHRYLQPVDLSLTLVGKPREVRPAALAWLGSPWPTRGRFGLVVDDERAAPSSFSTVLRGRGERVEVREAGGWRTVATPLPPPPHDPASSPAGQLVRETVTLGGFDGEVRMQRAGAVALKVGYHPFWKARVDDRPATLLQLTPCFLGVQVPQGPHQVSFRFQNPPYQKLLFLGSLGGWLLLGLGLVVQRARRGRQR